jgi:hypothetical protein
VCVCVCAPDDRERGSQLRRIVHIRAAAARSSSSSMDGKENVREVASLQSVVSCGSYPVFSCRRRAPPRSFPPFSIPWKTFICQFLFFFLSLHSPLISIRTFFNLTSKNWTQFKHLKKERKKKKRGEFGVILCGVWCFYENLMDGQHQSGMVTDSSSVSLLIIFPSCFCVCVSKIVHHNGNSSQQQQQQGAPNLNQRLLLWKNGIK